MPSEITVRSLAGDMKKYIIDLNVTDTVKKLTEKVAADEKIESNMIQLVYSGKPLQDADKLEDKGIEHGVTVFKIYRLTGG